PVRLREVILQVLVRQPRLPVLLNPFHAARREVRRRPAARAFLQELEVELGGFERKAVRAFFRGAADREDLAADFPHVRAAPLYDVARGRQRGAEGVVLVVGHRLSAYRLDVRNSSYPRPVNWMKQKPCPNGSAISASLPYGCDVIS